MGDRLAVDGGSGSPLCGSRCGHRARRFAARGGGIGLARGVWGIGLAALRLAPLRTYGQLHLVSSRQWAAKTLEDKSTSQPQSQRPRGLMRAHIGLVAVFEAKPNNPSFSIKAARSRVPPLPTHCCILANGETKRHQSIHAQWRGLRPEFVEEPQKTTPVLREAFLCPVSAKLLTRGRVCITLLFF